MRLFLIRHGQTPSNVAGLLDTRIPGPGLTDLGHEQAAQIPDALRAQPIDGIWVSIMGRTSDTAAPLAEDRGLTPVELAGFHEIAAGDLEMRSDHPSVMTYLQTAFAWGVDDLDPRMPGGEDGHEFFARFDASIAQVFATGARVAVVFSHGAAIRVWSALRSKNVKPPFTGDWELHNTGVVELDGDPETGWTLLSWQGTPIGGIELEDDAAEDPTGEPVPDS